MVTQKTWKEKGIKLKVRRYSNGGFNVSATYPDGSESSTYIPRQDFQIMMQLEQDANCVEDVA